MVNFFKFIAYFLRQNRIFIWLITLLLNIILLSVDHQSSIKFETGKILIVKEKIPKNVLIINSGGDAKISKSDSFVLQTYSRKKKKFDITYHHKLEQYFPDWSERMNYQEKQEKFYKLAIKNKKELSKLRIKNDVKFYSKEELNAIDYVHGTGFYVKYRDPKLKPNIFDTRETFLFKMHDSTLRNNFLNSLNSSNP